MAKTGIGSLIPPRLQMTCRRPRISNEHEHSVGQEVCPALEATKANRRRSILEKKKGF